MLRFRAALLCATFLIVTLLSSAQTAPHIDSISPSTVYPGDQVTITGTNFGSQSTGSVWLAQAWAYSIASWTDTQIVATVAPASVTQNVRISQGGL